MLSDAAPALEKVIDLFYRFGNWLLGNKEFISEFLKVVAVGLGAIALVAAPIELTTAAVIALAGGIALLWQDYQTWKRGGDSLIDWGKWEPGITAATKGIKVLGETISTTLEFIKTLRDAIRDKSNPELESYDTIKWLRGGAKTIHGNPVSDQAKAQAARVSKMTGIPADILFAQWEHETGGFTNRGARDLNNLAGVNVPGGKGQDYRSFKSLDEFGNYYAYLMRSGGRYDAARSAKTPEAFAAALKAGGYYTGSQSDYSKDMRAWMGTPGASKAAGGASGASSDTNRYLHIGEITIQTQATDAPGIANSIGESLQDYLFTSQANTGLAH